MKAAAISEKGFRPVMEDFYFLDTDFAGKGWIYGGIYDGHGGDYAARYAAKHLHILFFEKIKEGYPPSIAFTESYESISGKLSLQGSGTTAVDFLIRDGWIYTANVGDAEAILVTAGKYVELTTPHRLDNAAEKQRVLQTGAIIEYPYVVRGNQGLMPTRALGDAYFRKAGVISTPSTHEHQISGEDYFLISATDGLWDFIDKDEVVDFTLKYSEPADLLEALKREVLENRPGSDNLTAIAVNLKDE